MADTTGRPSLMPPLATYRAYFARSDTDTFRGHYASVLRAYHIHMENAATAAAST